MNVSALVTRLSSAFNNGVQSVVRVLKGMAIVKPVTQATFGGLNVSPTMCNLNNLEYIVNYIWKSTDLSPAYLSTARTDGWPFTGYIKLNLNSEW